MRIAIFGANSQISKDLIRLMIKKSDHELFLFSRNPEGLRKEIILTNETLNVSFSGYDQFHFNAGYDAIINFVGAGNPADVLKLGAKIFEITEHYDQLALSYLEKNVNCKYIFLSSGAVYGSDFEDPVSMDTFAMAPINQFLPEYWYGMAKLKAEISHRANHHLSIFDLRVFNYFSSTVDLNAKFFMCDIIRSIKENSILYATAENITRDYLHPIDFHNLIELILESSPSNVSVDCYSLAPIDKVSLLNEMKTNFKLNFKLLDDKSKINPTGSKMNYYSENHLAASFGYQPVFSSLSGVCRETEIILMQKFSGSL